MRSLSARLVVAVSLLLAVFFGATIVLLDLAFRNTAERGLRERLDVQLLVLIAAAEPAPDGGVAMPEELAEARLMTPGSGLYAQIAAPQGELLWRSPSAVGSGLPVIGGLPPGESRFERALTVDEAPVFLLSLGLEWELDDGAAQRFVFAAAESLEPYYDQIGRFRRQLFSWFALLTVALLIGQAVLLRWALRPLRRIAREIGEIEAGTRSHLSQEYPRELRGVTRNMNKLIRAERERLARYRDTLGNLAHSLKTPLAVIRASLERGTNDPEEHTKLIHKQVDDMNQIVGYQLQRAAAMGGTTLGHAPVEVVPVIDDVCASLSKVYADKSIAFRCDTDTSARFYGDRGDLMEIVGNLLDNACKWCNHQVFVRLRRVDGESRPGLTLRIEDDGPGISEQDAQRLLQRGVRGDERVAGHGIGLSVVAEIVALQDGRIRIGRSSLGGAKVDIELPAS